MLKLSPLFTFLVSLLFLPPAFPKGLLEEAPNFRKIDFYALNTPKSEEKNLVLLTSYLTRPYYDDREKVRSIYAWIVNNISYDYQLAEKTPAVRQKKISTSRTLKKRKTICSGYSLLFKEMCSIANIESEIVNGYSRKYNFQKRKPFSWQDHSWNAVKLHGKWFLLDATWETKHYTRSGKEIGTDYFLADPIIFVQDHLPGDPIWQLLYCPISIEEFSQSLPDLKELLTNADTCLYFNNHIEAIKMLSSPYKELEIARKVYEFNPRNHLDIGTASLNYGGYLSAKNSSKKYTKESISKEKEALEYFTQALRHLKKTEKEDHPKKEIIASCQKAILNSRTKIEKFKALERKVKLKKTLI